MAAPTNPSVCLQVHHPSFATHTTDQIFAMLEPHTALHKMLHTHITRPPPEENKNQSTEVLIFHHLHATTAYQTARYLWTTDMSPSFTTNFHVFPYTGTNRWTLLSIYKNLQEQDLIVQPIYTSLTDLTSPPEGTIINLAIPQEDLSAAHTFQEPDLQHQPNIVLLHTPYLQLRTPAEIKTFLINNFPATRLLHLEPHQDKHHYRLIYQDKKTSQQAFIQLHSLYFPNSGPPALSLYKPHHPIKLQNHLNTLAACYLQTVDSLSQANVISLVKLNPYTWPPWQVTFHMTHHAEPCLIPPPHSSAQAHKWNPITHSPPLPCLYDLHLPICPNANPWLNTFAQHFIHSIIQHYPLTNTLGLDIPDLSPDTPHTHISPPPPTPTDPTCQGCVCPHHLPPPTHPPPPDIQQTPNPDTSPTSTPQINPPNHPHSLALQLGDISAHTSDTQLSYSSTASTPQHTPVEHLEQQFNPNQAITPLNPNSHTFIPPLPEPPLWYSFPTDTQHLLIPTDYTCPNCSYTIFQQHPSVCTICFQHNFNIPMIQQQHLQDFPAPNPRELHARLALLTLHDFHKANPLTP